MASIATTVLGWLLGPLWQKVAEWFDGWFERGKIKAQSKLEIEVAKAKAEAAVYEKRASAEIDWEMKMADASDRSWKDEWILVLWSLPFIGAFLPFFQPYVKEGFTFLQATAPDWYVQTWGIIVAASFAVRGAVSIFRDWIDSRKKK